MAQLYTLKKYRRKDGSFNYDQYVKVQTKANKAKLSKIWASGVNIEFISQYVLAKIGQPEFVLCHGTRNGAEQQWFKQYLNCKVLGTEISTTASQFPDTIQWDFHNVKPEWIDAVDVIYSNAWDHSYNPKLCLTAWMSCVKPGKFCLLEHSRNHTAVGVKETDPFGVELEVFPFIIATWGAGNFAVREILTPPKTIGDRKVIVIQRF